MFCDLIQCCLIQSCQALLAVILGDISTDGSAWRGDVGQLITYIIDLDILGLDI